MKTPKPARQINESQGLLKIAALAAVLLSQLESYEHGEGDCNDAAIFEGLGWIACEIEQTARAINKRLYGSKEQD